MFKKNAAIFISVFTFLTTLPLLPAIAAENDWLQMNISGFDGSDDNTSTLLFPRNGELYGIVTAGTPGGVRAYQYENNGNTEWSEITDWPFLDDENNQINNTAYVVNQADNSKYFGFHNRITGAEVWRLKKNGNWDQVNTDGFGDDKNQFVQHMAMYSGQAMNNKKSIVAVVWGNETGNYSLMGHQVSNGGTEWETIGTLPDSVFTNNGSLNAFTVFKNKFYIGTGKLGKVFESENGTDWVLVHTRNRGKISQLVTSTNGTQRLFMLGSSRYRNCGEYKEQFQVTTNGTDWKTAAGRPNVKACLSGLHFRQNGRGLLHGYTTQGSDGDGTDIKDVYVFNRRGSSIRTETTNGFNDNTTGISSVTVWQGYFVLATINKTDGTEIYIKAKSDSLPTF